MTKPIISVENLSKAYRLGAKEESPDTLVGVAKSLVTAPVRNFRELSSLNTFKEADKEEPDTRTLWALKDVSFDVQEGEVVGVIGRNGAGKSTLLKILSRITEPTSGRAVIRGRVSSLLEVGTGFHPELSGRDNVYMNGTILGMTKREIDRKFDEIVDFSGVEKFLDTPVKRYSSGMQVRLAFAVAAHLEPEILIVDEVLAVGDFSFQKKCLGKMKDVTATGRTVLFVSHNMEAVKSLCGRVVLLEKSTNRYIGNPATAISMFTGSDGTQSALSSNNLNKRTDRSGNGQVRLEGVEFLDSEGRSIDSVPMGERLVIQLRVKSNASISRLRIGIGVLSLQGMRLFRLDTHDVGEEVSTNVGDLTVECSIDSLSLLDGNYLLSVDIRDEMGRYLDKIEDAKILSVTANDVFGSGRLLDRNDTFFLHSEWCCKEKIETPQAGSRL